MIKCTDERKSDEFFNEYYNDIKDNYKIKQLFKFFKNRTIKYTNNKAPDTEYKKHLMIEQKPSYIQMLYNKPYWFCDKKLSSTKIYELSIEYGKKKYLSTNYSSDRFSKDIKNIIGDFKKKSNGIMVYCFPSILVLKEFLYNNDKKYYRYVNGFDEDEEINFEVNNDYDPDEDKSFF